MPWTAFPDPRPPRGTLYGRALERSSLVSSWLSILYRSGTVSHTHVIYGSENHSGCDVLIKNMVGNFDRPLADTKALSARKSSSTSFAILYCTLLHILSSRTNHGSSICLNYRSPLFGARARSRQRIAGKTRASGIRIESSESQRCDLFLSTKAA